MAGEGVEREVGFAVIVVFKTKTVEDLVIYADTNWTESSPNTVDN